MYFFVRLHQRKLLMIINTKTRLIVLASLLMVVANSYLSTLHAQEDSKTKKPTKVAQSDSIATSKPSVQSSISASTLFDSEGNIVNPDSLSMYVWKVLPRLGERIIMPMDTATINFGQSTLAESKTLGAQFLGNIGSAFEPIDYFQRESNPDFPFMDVVQPWYLTPKNNKFYNTKVPYTNVDYQSGGGGNTNESRVSIVMTSNYGKKLNVGFNFDYIYARGFYSGLFNKQTSYDFFASYTGERYKMDFFGGNNHSNAATNGGIIDDRYITNPNSTDLESSRSNSKDIPVYFEDGLRNKMRGRYFFVSNSYDLGDFYEEITNDSTVTYIKKTNYIAPASVIYTLDYQDQRRTFSTPQNMLNSDSLNAIFVPNFKTENFTDGTILGKYTDNFNDYMSYYSFKNTIGFRMNEGFKEWTKFGLTVFAEANFRKYLLPDDEIKQLNVTHSDDIYSIGATLSSNKGKYLKYNLTVVKGVNKSNTELHADVMTRVPIKDDQIALKANLDITKTPASFFQNNFVSRNWRYHEDFDDVKKFRIGAELLLPKFSISETSISAGYENISNMIYINNEYITDPTYQFANWSKYRRTPTQYTSDVNVLSFKLKEKLNLGILNIELQGLLQKSSNEDIVPLPKWTISANAYLLTKLSKVLTVQLGVESYMFEKYYARGYDPLFNQFYNQNKEDAKAVEIGGFPFTNAYINLHLKYTRFFVMMYNVTKGMGNRSYFTTPHYPIDPTMFRWGLSWRFNN